MLWCCQGGSSRRGPHEPAARGLPAAARRGAARPAAAAAAGARDARAAARAAATAARATRGRQGPGERYIHHVFNRLTCNAKHQMCVWWPRNVLCIKNSQ